MSVSSLLLVESMCEEWPPALCNVNPSLVTLHSLNQNLLICLSQQPKDSYIVINNNKSTRINNTIQKNQVLVTCNKAHDFQALIAHTFVFHCSRSNAKLGTSQLKAGPELLVGGLFTCRVSHPYQSDRLGSTLIPRDRCRPMVRSPHPGA